MDGMTKTSKDTRFHRLDPSRNPIINRTVDRLRRIIVESDVSEARIKSVGTILLFHRIGEELHVATADCLWGDRLIDEVAVQLRTEFPQMKFLRRENLYTCRSFYECFTERDYVRDVVSRMPWTSIGAIVSARGRCDTESLVRDAIDNGWSTAKVDQAIKSGVYALQPIDYSQVMQDDCDKVFRTVKIHLRLAHSQKKLFDRFIRMSMCVYNELYDRALIHYLEHGVVLFREELVEVLRKLKRENGSYQEVPEVILQNICSRVHSAVSNFDDAVNSDGARFPRSRTLQDYRSVTYDQPKTIRLQGDRLWLGSMPRLIKMSKHQPLEDIRSCTIVHENTGKWYAYVVHRRARRPTPPTGDIVDIGVDLGLGERATFSDGMSHPLPSFDDLEHRCDELRSKRDRSKDPQYRAKCNRLLSKAHSKLINKRDYVLHCQTRALVDRSAMIAIEDLDMPDLFTMQVYSQKRRRMQNASWGRYVRMLEYKSEETEHCKVVKVDPRYSSQ